MYNIWGGLFLLSIGTGFSYGAMTSSSNAGFIFFALAVGSTVWGIYQVLFGLRAFFLNSVLIELKRIADGLNTKTESKN